MIPRAWINGSSSPDDLGKELISSNVEIFGVLIFWRGVCNVYLYVFIYIYMYV